MIEWTTAVLLLILRLAALAPQAEKAEKASANTVASREVESETVPADRPALKAAELYDARDFDKALPVAEEAVQQAWREFGGDDSRTIAAEEFLAHLAALNKDPARAQAIREETDRKLARLGNEALAEKVKTVRTEDYRESAPEKGN